MLPVTGKRCCQPGESSPYPNNRGSIYWCSLIQALAEVQLMRKKPGDIAFMKVVLTNIAVIKLVLTDLRFS